MATREFESLWTIGDHVSLTFPENGIIKQAVVCKVSFDRENVLYDVNVPYTYRGYKEDGTLDEYPRFGNARIHGLKEWHLRNPESYSIEIVEEEQQIKTLKSERDTAVAVLKAIYDTFPEVKEVIQKAAEELKVSKY